MPLSPQQKDKYDLDWVGSMPVPVKSSDSRNAYFLLKLKVPGTVAGNTTIEQEDNISNHRVGECAIPGMGCIKIPVVMRIDYNYYDPYNRSDVARTQKHCMDIKVMIDRCPEACKDSKKMGIPCMRRFMGAVVDEKSRRMDALHWSKA